MQVRRGSRSNGQPENPWLQLNITQPWEKSQTSPDIFFEFYMMWKEGLADILDESEQTEECLREKLEEAQDWSRRAEEKLKELMQREFLHQASPPKPITTLSSDPVWASQDDWSFPGGWQNGGCVTA